jgi:hypothetical protein
MAERVHPPGVGRRLHEVTPLKSFAEQAHVLAVKPKQFDQSTAFSAEDKQDAAERVLLQHLRRQHRQPVHSFAHIGRKPARPAHQTAG